MTTVPAVAKPCQTATRRTTASQPTHPSQAVNRPLTCVNVRFRRSHRAISRSIRAGEFCALRRVGRRHADDVSAGETPSRGAGQPIQTQPYHLSRQPLDGTTTTPVAVVARIGGVSTAALDSSGEPVPRHTTRTAKSISRERRPTRVSVASISMTSPARTGARNLSLIHISEPTRPY